jgi:hypothetical protein
MTAQAQCAVRSGQTMTFRGAGALQLVNRSFSQISDHTGDSHES